MLISEIIILESFVVYFAVITVVFRIGWLYWLFISVIDHFLGGGVSIDL